MTNYFNRIGSCSVRARLAALALLLSVFGPAQAAITCSINPPASLNFAIVAGTNSTDPGNKIQNAVVATCQRNLVSDPTTAALTLGANDGAQPSATSNQALFSGNLVRYNLYRNVGCTAQFRGGVVGVGVPLPANFASTTLSPVTVTFDYWGCVPGQTITSFPAGVYTDSVALTLRNGAATLATSAIVVNINAPAKCSIGGLVNNNITFSYTAFGSANFQSLSFSADCTNLLPYTMDLNPVSGVVGGLRYELGLADAVGSAGNLGPATLSRVGGSSGSRGHVINGAMPSNQAGDRSAIAPQPHTLTITY